MKTLEQKIMSRVRRIYYLRKLTGPTAMKAYALVALTLALVSLVSVVNVVANMPPLATPGPFVDFLTSAILHTETTVQAVLIGLCILVALMVRDVVHTARHAHLPLVRI